VVAFAIADWAALAPARRRRADWLAWAGARADAVPAAEPEAERALPQLLRRRVTPIGQLALRAAHGLAAPVDTRFVFCSRHGEFERTVGLLRMLATDEPVSPAEFSLSVHHALAGLLSIALKNEAGHTAVAAGRDSFAAGLLEAVTTLAAGPEQPVLLVYYDDALPEPYAPFRDLGDTAVALALLLTAPEPGRPGFEFAPVAATASAPASATEQALGFLRFLLHGEAELTLAGERHDWRCRRADA
jgi:hypothetical protein